MPCIGSGFGRLIFVLSSFRMNCELYLYSICTVIGDAGFCFGDQKPSGKNRG